MDYIQQSFLKKIGNSFIRVSSVVCICIRSCVGMCLWKFVCLPGCLTKTGHKSSGTLYKVKGVLADSEPKIENGNESPESKVLLSLSILF